MGLNHYLINSIRQQEGGVDAYNFVMSKLDPKILHVENKLSNKMDLIAKLELTSIEAGAFARFHAKFETLLMEAEALGAPEYSDDVKKALLISKLKHEDYKLAKLPQATSAPYDKYLAELGKYAYMTEDDPQRHTTGKHNRTIREAKQIGGHEVDDDGLIPKAQWDKLTKEERKKFMQTRRTEEATSDSESSTKRELKKLKAQIKNLTSIDDSGSTSEEATTKTSNTSKNKSYADPAKAEFEEGFDSTNKKAKALILNIMKNNQIRKVNTS